MSEIARITAALKPREWKELGYVGSLTKEGLDAFCNAHGYRYEQTGKSEYGRYISASTPAAAAAL